MYYCPDDDTIIFYVNGGNIIGEIKVTEFLCLDISGGNSLELSIQSGFIPLNSTVVASANFSYKIISTLETITIPAGQEMLVYQRQVVDGVQVINGSLVII